ncbi:unnamed protein product [Chrysoparadoxa australica]
MASRLLSFNSSKLELVSKKGKLAKKPKKATPVESKPRREASTSGWVESKEHAALPVKDKAGQLQLRVLAKRPAQAEDGESERDDEEGGEEEDVEEEEEEEEEEREEVIAPPKQQPMKASDEGGQLNEGLRWKRYKIKRQEIAQLCSACLENPESSLNPRKEGGGKLHQLHAMMDDGDIAVRHLVMLSEYAVFRDIIPGFRIRVLTEKEKSQPVSKEVQRVRGFEASLLSSYQSFLKTLDEAFRTPLKTNSNCTAQALALSAAKCLCGLLTSHSHFNFRTNLVCAVVSGMSSSSHEIRQQCLSCVTNLFKSDPLGNVTLEVVRAIAKFSKSKGFCVSAEVLECCWHLPLHVHESDAARARARMKSKNRKRKRHGNTVSSLLDVQEANVGKDADEQARNHADTLKEVTLLYFRVLKHSAPSQAVVRAALKGLALVSHLINLDTVVGLLDTLEALLLEEDGSKHQLDLQSAMCCIRTALAVLRGPGGMCTELMLDEKKFLCPLYNLIPRLADGSSASASCIGLVCECLELAFLKRKEESTARVGAFIKRLATVALHLPSSEALPVLTCIHHLLSRYPKARQLTERGGGGRGIYLPEATDPDVCNPFAASCWEGEAK